MTDGPENPAGGDDPALETEPAPIVDSEPATEVTPAEVLAVDDDAPLAPQPEAGAGAAALEPSPVVPEAPLASTPEPPLLSTPEPPPIHTPYEPAYDSTSTSSSASAAGSDRPEIPIGAAFGGGLLLAMILKRLAR